MKKAHVTNVFVYESRWGGKACFFFFLKATGEGTAVSEQEKRQIGKSEIEVKKKTGWYLVFKPGLAERCAGRERKRKWKKEERELFDSE